MAKYRNIADVPFNATEDIEYFWESFMNQTQSGNPEKAIYAFHNYIGAKEKVLQKNKAEELSL